MLIGVSNLTKAKKAGKKVMAHGFGMSDMIKKCYKKGLNKGNSTLIVRDLGSMNSEYWVVEGLV